MIDNLRTKWVKAAGHMQAAARQQQGFAVIKIEILVDPNGDPVLWFDPCVRKLSPLVDSKQFIGELLAATSKDFG